MAAVWLLLLGSIWPAVATAQVSGELKLLRTRRTAPGLEGAGQWINTAAPLRLEDLKGKYVVLDFWTYCCSNCMHILPELKKLERKYPHQLVVIGVHSGKFDTERDSDNIREAVRRHDIEHPVVNDPERVLWRRYAVDMWPTLCVIDPEGKWVARHNGEIRFEPLSVFFERGIANARRRGVLDETPLRIDKNLEPTAPAPLRFPGKILTDEAGNRLVVADSGHNRIVVATLAGQVLHVIGTGAVGRNDGPYDEATFDHPQGLALNGDVLFVADTENHLIRRIDLAERTVTTVAGTGKQATIPPKAGNQALNSPWDLCWFDDNLYIAMAGAHQLWTLKATARRATPFAGTGTEDVIDGPIAPRAPDAAAFAQPSALATDGTVLFVADSEGSSVRVVPLSGEGSVLTPLGTSRLPANRLFTFGDRDGAAAQALLQHPLGVAWHRGKLFIADTYNNKIKELDLGTSMIRTIAGDVQSGDTDDPPRLNEPAGISVAGGKLYVADTNNHSIRVIRLDDLRMETLPLVGLEPPSPAAIEPIPAIAAESVRFEPTKVRPVDGQLAVAIDLQLPPDHKINTQAPHELVLEAKGKNPFDPSALGKPIRVKRPGTRIEVQLPLRSREGTASLALQLRFYYCRDGAEGACRVGTVRWTGQVQLDSAAAERLSLSFEVSPPPVEQPEG